MDKDNPTINDNDLQAFPNSTGDENVERLLTVYAPEEVHEAFEADVVTRMQAAAAKQHAPHRFTVSQYLIAAAMIVLVGLIAISVVDSLHRSPRQPNTKTNDPNSIKAVAHDTLNEPDNAPFTQLTVQRRMPSAPDPQVNVGQLIRTLHGERRRMTLPDGSLLYLNENSVLKVQADRHLILASGKLYVEVATSPQATDKSANKPTDFIVDTASRQFKAIGTKFAVDVVNGLATVLVTQGQVYVSDVDAPVQSGQQLEANQNTAQPAPRATHALDWTQQLMAAADSPLVPASNYEGGALVITDAAGNEGRLSLKQIHVDVHIEDGFARTTVDQVYFNHEDRRLEGVFYFPLPNNSSISRLAMYVGRQLNEAGMIERKRGREVFETIRYQRRDPALLEWMDGSMFRMRVFPIEARENKRIIISYTQKLETAYDRTSYRFPAGHSLGKVGIWSFHANVKNGAQMICSSSSHDLSPMVVDGDLHLRANATDVRTDKDIVLQLHPHKPDGKASESARKANIARDAGEAGFKSFVDGDHRYVMMRYRPALAAVAKQQPRHWVFLFESSADRNPLLARAQVDIVRHMLRNMDRHDTFDLITANARVRRFPLPSSAMIDANIDSAVKWLEQTHLVGALDLQTALTEAVSVATATRDHQPDATHQPVIVHLGTGIPVLASRDEDQLLDIIPAHVQYVGIGVGKRWSRPLMTRAAARTSGYVTQVNPDEPIAWRSFEVMSALNATRLHDVSVHVDGKTEATWLTDTKLIAHGESVFAVTRLPKSASLPAALSIRGTHNGQPWQQKIKLTPGKANAGYLPRYWAKLEIDRLLARGGEKHREQIVKLSMAMYVMSPYTSLLVLEDDAMYEQYNVDKGRQDHWAKYPAPKLLPLPNQLLRGYEHIGTLMADGAYDDAIKELWRDYRKDSSNTEVMVLLAKCYAAQGKTDATNKMLKQVLAINPDQPDALSMLQQIDMSTQSQPDALELARRLVIRERIELGKQAEIQENFRVAMEHYVYVLNNFDPNHAEAKSLVATVQAKWDRSSPGERIEVASNELRLLAQRIEAEYDELVIGAWRQSLAGNHQLGEQAVQEAKVILDRNKTALGKARYEELRSKANALYADIATKRLQSDHAAMERQASEDAASASRRRLEAEVEKFDSVQRLLRRAYELRKTQNYDRSLHLVNQALFLDPDNPAGQAMKEMMEDAKIAVRSREFYRERSKRFAHHSMESIEATIPYNELITYPSDWPQLTATRLNPSLWHFDAAESELNRRVSQKLTDPVPIQFEDNKIVNIIDYFRNTTGVNFFVNWSALESIGIEEDMKITLQLEGVSAERGLRLTLETAAAKAKSDDINFMIIDGVVHISTASDLRGPSDTRVYDIKALLDLEEDQTKRAAQLERIMTTIQDTTGDKLAWKDRHATMRELNEMLIIKAGGQHHWQINRILIAMRAIRGLEMGKDPASLFKIDKTEVARPNLSETHGKPSSAGDLEMISQLEVTMAAMQYFVQRGRVEKADALLRPLLEKNTNLVALSSEYWRLGAGIASTRGDLTRTIRYLETALAIDYDALPESIDLDEARADHLHLLGVYESLIVAHEVMKHQPPEGLVAKIVRATDRLRALDPNPTTVCHKAADLLKRLNRPELAWDYLTTPMAEQPGEAMAWVEFGKALETFDKLNHAADAYYVAFTLEQSNPQFLLLRLQALHRMMRIDDAKKVAQLIWDGNWHSRFIDVIREAQAYLREHE